MVAARGRQLQRALNERDYLADLASRPLLLTLMATLHSSWGQLPDDRADLYEETVKLLLGRWERAREVRTLEGELVAEPGIAQVLGVGIGHVRRALEALAFSVHQRQRRDPEDREGPADIGEGEVLVACKALLGKVEPALLLGYLEERAGLLLARRPGVYAFPHRSFQEFLAACYLADQSDFGERLHRLVNEDPVWQRELCLLAVGKARQGGLGAAVNAVNALLPDEPGDRHVINDHAWRVAVLAGQAVLDLRLANDADAPRPHRAVANRTRRWLAKLIGGGHLPPTERLEAGDLLGRLGDPRPGVGVVTRSIGENAAKLPDIAWVHIPAGPFSMGSTEDDPDAYAAEQPQHAVDLPDYWIAQYPITNHQFRPFIEGDGYENERYWTPEGWAWRQGAEPDLSLIEDQSLRDDYRRWLANRPAERRNRPFYWEDARFGAATRPVVGVSWHEAVAYTRWLVTHLGGAVTLPGAGATASPLPPNYTFRLPNEAEWEKAARGPDGRRWPWTGEWDAAHANMKETGLEQTSPVGAFPRGASAYGLHDMAGNVWEWTQSRWGRTSSQDPDYAYPYDPRDGRELLDGPDWRIVRGGSWFNDLKHVRCAVRGRYVPDNFIFSYGFRVVVSLAVF